MPTRLAGCQRECLEIRVSDITRRVSIEGRQAAPVCNLTKKRDPRSRRVVVLDGQLAEAAVVAPGADENERRKSV